MANEKYKKLGYAAVSLLPGGQYYVAKKKGKSEEELKWFKRLEYARLVSLAGAGAAAMIGDPLGLTNALSAYTLSSLPVNLEKTDEKKYALEKEKLASKKGILGKIRRGLHGAKTRLKDAISDPEVATYASLALATNTVAAIGGGEKMLYVTVPDVDIVTHIAAGFSYSKLADKAYERGNVADYLKEKLETVADKIDGKKSKLHSAAKYAVKKLSEHPKEVLGMSTIAAAGTLNELYEKVGSGHPNLTGIFGETNYNRVQDEFMNLAGSLAHYYRESKRKTEKK